MSTRSGKRIRKSEQDDDIEDTILIQSERKTQSSKQKESVEVHIKKRNNYVTYPTDDHVNEPHQANNKSSGRTRRNTLKEHNVDEYVSVTNAINDKSKVNKSGKHKKHKDNENFVVEDIENTQKLNLKQVGIDKKKSKKKKNQKKTMIEQDGNLQNGLKKKNEKKKKKVTSIHKYQNNTDLANKIDISTDSFHSATNSPVVSQSIEGILKDNSVHYFEGSKPAGGLSNGKCVTENDHESDVSHNFKEHENTNKFDSSSPNASEVTKQKRKSRVKKSLSLKNTKNIETKENEAANTVEYSISDIELPRTGRLCKIAKDSSNYLNPLNKTSEKGSKGGDSRIEALDITFEKEEKLDMNLTFEVEKIGFGNSENESKKSSLISSDAENESKKLSLISLDAENESKKSSLISSDATLNITYDKSNDSRISDSSDKTKTENILNYTPVLVESSIDETQSSEIIKTPEMYKTETPSTPFKREGTFTKDDAVVITSKPKISMEKTPVKRKSVPSPGSTPFPLLRCAQNDQKEKRMLNVTRSIEKSMRRSSEANIVPRQTKVMFCSPANNPTVVLQVKGKVIKSNLKGSNKSFVFNSSVSSDTAPSRRKRSLTHCEGDTHAKRKRFTDDQQHSVDRLSRPRTLSAAAKLVEPCSPARKVARTRLPNFAALHQKQFAKMESLDECQRRRAQRARQLLTPTGSVTLIQRTSPNGTSTNSAQETQKPITNLHTPSKTKLPTLASLNPGYTRFGFRLNTDNNPFPMTATKVEVKPKEKSANEVTRRTTSLALPSLAGATAARQHAARQAVMREKSFAEKRDITRKENRTIIKGVRTNRRFELQMKLRNVNT